MELPSSDYVRDHLLMGPSYGLDTDIAKKMSGFVTNPMERAEASKLAIFSVGEYCWNMKVYKPAASWEKAIKTLYDPFRIRCIAYLCLSQLRSGPNGH